MTFSRFFVLCVVASALVAAAPSSADERRLIEFEMEDQFRTVHQRSDVTGDVVVLIGSDRGGSDYNAAWRDALQEALRSDPRHDRVSFVSHADLRVVPRPARGLARRVLVNHTERPVLTDWNGTLAEAYDYAPGVSNLLVFAPDGALVHQAAGREPDDEAIDDLVAIVVALLGELE